MWNKIKQKIVNWCLGINTMTVGELYAESNPQQVDIADFALKTKFIGQGKTEKLVLTPTGYSPIKSVLKTIEYKTWKVVVDGFPELYCADNHIIMTYDGEKFAKDLQRGDLVYTKAGLRLVFSVEELVDSQNMYDLEIDDENHVFYTNGILSHNTTVVAMYILWFSMFNESKRCIIASKAMAHAVEIAGRIKYAYEEMPNWLKAGCKFYNRTSIEFDNNSKIICEATSEKTGRGSSPSIIFLDEIAFISKRIQDEMWASLTPALSTGGKFIITSTPNGDSDLFAKIWHEALEGKNSFVPLKFLWWMHPDRSPESGYYEEMVGKLGPIKTATELDCEFQSEESLLINANIIFKKTWTKPVYEDMGFQFWKPQEEIGGKGKTYLVFLDPATGSGKDSSAIEVFEFPSLIQVAEYKSNILKIPLLYAKLSWLLKFLGRNVNGRAADVLWSFERNGVGEAVAALYYNDENAPEMPELYCDSPGKFGVSTQGKTKLVFCIEMKMLIEKAVNGLILNSEYLITELKHFVSKGISYEAKQGHHDDCVMALVGIVRLLKRMAEYDETAFKKVNEYVNPDDSIDDNNDYIPFIVI